MFFIILLPDVNECRRGSHNCDKRRAICENTLGGYTCTCKPGYQGNGRFCRGKNAAWIKCLEPQLKGENVKVFSNALNRF